MERNGLGHTPRRSGNSRVQAREAAAKVGFTVAAFVSVAAVALICVFLLVNSIPALREIGVWPFLSGTEWRPGSGAFGLLPMIMGSLYVTALALLLGVPVGVLTAIYIACFSSPRMERLLTPAVRLMAGIPSVVYGFFGLMAMVPAIRTVFGGAGSSMLAASVLLAIMILPTIITVSVSSIKAVPNSYYEAAIGLGSTHERAVFRVVAPAARPGIMTGVVLGMGRAIGETMAVMMVAGNQPRMPAGLLKGVRTLTTNIVMEMGYSADLHRQALIATALVLFVFILLSNIFMKLALERRRS